MTCEYCNLTSTGEHEEHCSLYYNNPDMVYGQPTQNWDNIFNFLNETMFFLEIKPVLMSKQVKKYL